MHDLTKTIVAVRDRIERFRRDSSLNEENTKATLIDPILRALGWDLEDLDEVQREYKAKRSDKPVDYGLLLMRMPKLFIEAKALHHDLGDRKWSNQIMGYAAVAGVEWVLLTNGDEYRIYNAHVAVDVDQKLFRMFRITANDGVAEETLALLSREHLRDNRLQALWDAHFVDRQVKVALEVVFEPGDDASLVRLLRSRISSVSVANLRASLRRARIEVTFPAPADELPSRPKNGDPRLRLAKGTRRSPVSTGVTMADLRTAGLLRPPVDLFASYRGVDVRARIDSDGLIHVDDTTTTSLSSAPNTARETVLRARGEPRSVQTNGSRRSRSSTIARLALRAPVRSGRGVRAGVDPTLPRDRGGRSRPRTDANGRSLVGVCTASIRCRMRPRFLTLPELRRTTTAALNTRSPRCSNTVGFLSLVVIEDQRKRPAWVASDAGFRVAAGIAESQAGSAAA